MRRKTYTLVIEHNYHLEEAERLDTIQIELGYMSDVAVTGIKHARTTRQTYAKQDLINRLDAIPNPNKKNKMAWNVT